jgi:hypothetical protein
MSSNNIYSKEIVNLNGIKKLQDGNDSFTFFLILKIDKN